MSDKLQPITLPGLIERLKLVTNHVPAEEQVNSLADIITDLELVAEKVRADQEEREDIQKTISKYRRELNIWDKEITSLPDDVNFLLLEMSNQLKAEKDNAAALRGSLEETADTLNRREYEDGKPISLNSVLTWAQRIVADSLESNNAGAALRKDIRQLEVMVKGFEESARRNGDYWSYNDPTLASKVQRVVDHYTRMAASSVSNARSFKDDILTWLRAMAINAESVSWAGTHQEKNARLRGLVEVIERACKDVNEMRLEDRNSWGSYTNDWMKSDFPVREYKSRIYELERENQQLKEAQALTVDEITDERF